ncbi:hypothetical protein ACG2LH_13595 [Zhouia sp. PK063]|uniref:hypothetical protein n=1 Tax=Zhouia sp. PK063 TaxID=3373602 RepID=UPI00379660D0
MNIKVYIDSGCDILYSSFYVQGLFEKFGKKNVFFTKKGFEKFKHNNHFLAFIIVSENRVLKYVIDFADSSEIDGEALEWCNTYGKINLEEKDSLTNKIIPIGPSFGIKIFNLRETIFYAIDNYISARKSISNKKRFFSNYYAQLKRGKLEEYYPNASIKNNIFFISSLWKREKETNEFRANFIKACKEIRAIKFEGGFAPRSNNDIQGYENLQVKSRISFKEYLQKIKNSSVCFNTPAVLKCHGWKLAEFLCMGKVIISTPLSRIMPVSINDKETILYTSGSKEDILNKLNSVTSNIELFCRLERNSRIFFENELSPIKVVEKIVNY